MAGFFSGYQTSADRSFYGTGLDWLESTSQKVTDAAQQQGYRYTAGSSFFRADEFNRLEQATDMMKTQGYRSTKEIKSKEFLGKNYTPIKNTIQDVLDQFKERDEATIISKETLNKHFGNLGLNFDKDMLDIHAALLVKRKKNEIRNRYILSQAKGGRWFKGLAIEMGMAMLDPMNLGALLIPTPVGWASFSKGAFLGATTTAALEVPIYAQAQREQADYTMYMSMVNVAFGGIIGGGLHSLGTGISTWHAKRLAVKQLINDETVDAGAAHSSEVDLLPDDVPSKSLDEINLELKNLKKKLDEIKKEPRKVPKTKDELGEVDIDEIDVEARKKELRIIIHDLEKQGFSNKRLGQIKAAQKELKEIRDFEKGDTEYQDKVSEVETQMKHLIEERTRILQDDPEFRLKKKIMELEQRKAPKEEIAPIRKELADIIKKRRKKSRLNKLISGRDFVQQSIIRSKKVRRGSTSDVLDDIPGEDPAQRKAGEALDPDEWRKNARAEIFANTAGNPIARKRLLDKLKEMEKTSLKKEDIDAVGEMLEIVMGCKTS